MLASVMIGGRVLVLLLGKVLMMSCSMRINGPNAACTGKQCQL